MDKVYKKIFQKVKVKPYLRADRTDAGTDLGEVEHTLIVEGVGGEDKRIRDAVRLHEVVEQGYPLLLSHHAHRFNLRCLEGAVLPVDVAWIQRVDESGEEME